MDGHMSAIAMWLLPISLAIIGCGIMGICWLLKRTLESNAHDHERFFDLASSHEKVLVEHGVRLDKVETEVEFITHKERP